MYFLAGYLFQLTDTYNNNHSMLANFYDTHTANLIPLPTISNYTMIIMALYHTCILDVAQRKYDGKSISFVIYRYDIVRERPEENSMICKVGSVS